ncbi:hypothetical protein JG688_00012118 [Phytophthora aleatoria]|uniref:Secreted protein n=1 Tax=Phytophthora aleatoria TaxID=2496075 RepID=A0A8J5IFS9_9STRA|nr:hypothetical protein JG688_00012118 [Phytophthora aleatoria]
MESRLVSLLLVVLIVALPVDIRRKCLQHSRINWMERSQLLVDEGQFQRCYKCHTRFSLRLQQSWSPFFQSTKSNHVTGQEN